jgi:BASS family bile acid:Na+ symporter
MSEYIPLLTKIANLTMLAFMVSNMFAFGMRLSPGEILAPLRHVRHNLMVFVANFVIVPALAYALLHLLHIEGQLAIGLLLLATAGGDPAVTKFSGLAKGDPAYALAVMMALQIVSVFFMPIILPPLLPGVHVDPLKIAMPLVLFLLLPLVVGSLVRARWSGVAARLWKPFDTFSSFALVLVCALLFGLHFREMISQSVLVYASLLIFIWLGFFAGYFLGAPGQIRQTDLALNTSIRGVSASLAVAITNFPGQGDIITIILIYLAFLLATVAPCCPTVLRRKNVAAAQARGDTTGVAERSPE